MYPQFLITLDEDLQEKAVTVRVGQAVNTVGLAGTRMGISGVCVDCLLEFIAYLHFLVPNTSDASTDSDRRARRAGN